MALEISVATFSSVAANSTLGSLVLQDPFGLGSPWYHSLTNALTRSVLGLILETPSKNLHIELPRLLCSQLIETKRSQISDVLPGNPSDRRACAVSAVLPPKEDCA